MANEDLLAWGCGWCSGLHAAGGVYEKKSPGFRGIENRRADGFSVPAGIFPFRLDMKDRHPWIVTRENRQLPGAPVQLFREVAQADAAK